MKRFLTLLTVLITTYTAFAQQTGSISGTVNTSDGNAAAYVSVGVVGQNAGAVTDENGQYRINRVKPGTYTLKVTSVNLSAQQKEVTVTGGGNAVVDFMLDVNSSQLQEVVVKDRANRIKVDLPSQSLRLQGPLLEQAQNIQVVSSAALAEQQIISMSDGLIRNVSGAVRLEHWGDLYTNISMRGTQIQALRNGFNFVNSYWGPLTEDMSFVDHIEFVKGPAGFMVSNGDPSGLYNVVTKKPTGETKNELTLTTGSFGLYRGTLDMDGKLSSNGKLLYRLNIAGQSKKSFRDFEENNRWSIAPVISYQIDDKTKVTAEYTYQHAGMTNVGSFYVFDARGYARQPQNFTQVAPGLPLTNIDDHSLFVNLQHNIDNNWKITAAAAYSNYQQNGSSMWPTKVNPDGTMIRNVGIWDAKSTMALAQAFINGTVNTGSVRHRLLGGFDLGNKNYNADWGQSHDLDTEAKPFKNSEPNYGVPSNGFPVFDRTLNLEARAQLAGGIMNSEYASIYAMDELGFFDNNLRVSVGGRYTYVKQFYFGSTTGKKFTPRVGVSYSVDKQTAVYGVFDQSFLPQAAGVLENNAEVKPITASNLEFGIKRDWGTNGRWNTTVAVYRALRNDEASATDRRTPSGQTIFFLLGQRKTQGIEFDLRGEITKGLTLTANYALTDSRVSKVGASVPASMNIKVGDIVPGYAKHVANTWLSYKLQDGALKGSGIAAGFTFYGNRETDTWSESTVRLPNYFKVDGGLFWENSKIRINANVFNVFDKYLYSGSYYSYLGSFYTQAEAPRNFRVSLGYRF